MYKAIIGNSPTNEPGRDEEYFRNIVVSTNDKADVVDMLIFALNHNKSFVVTEVEDEISLDGIEELEEGGEN